MEGIFSGKRVLQIINFNNYHVAEIWITETTSDQESRLHNRLSELYYWLRKTPENVIMSLNPWEWIIKWFACIRKYTKPLNKYNYDVHVLSTLSKLFRIYTQEVPVWLQYFNSGVFIKSISKVILSKHVGSISFSVVVDIYTINSIANRLESKSNIFVLKSFY